MCVHTPGDNQVVTFLQKIFDTKKPETVGAVVELLLEIPEYRHSASLGIPPKVVCGAEKNRCGKVLVDMTGGTEGSKEAFEKLSHTDVGTVVCMHLSEEHIKEAEKHHVNAVIAGHIASDNVGINHILDVLERQGPLEIIETSGLQARRRGASSHGPAQPRRPRIPPRRRSRCARGRRLPSGRISLPLPSR